MRGLTKTMTIITGVVLSIIISWIIVIPDDVIRSMIEGVTTDTAMLHISVDGLRKTPLFGIKADTLIIKIQDVKIVDIAQPSARLNLMALFKRKFSLSLRGRIKDGEVHGRFDAPSSLAVDVKEVEVDSIPYLKERGFKVRGHLSGSIRIIDNAVNIMFEVPDLDIISTGSISIPFADTFQDIQGVINIKDERININSISLEGKKGYARIKGDITGKNPSLLLELMPYQERLTPTERMLMDRYQVSPGYYVIPINNLLPALGLQRNATTPSQILSD